MRDIVIAALLTASAWMLFAEEPVSSPATNPAPTVTVAEAVPVNAIASSWQVPEAVAVLPGGGVPPAEEYKPIAATTGPAVVSGEPVIIAATPGPAVVSEAPVISEFDQLWDIDVPFLSRMWVLRWRVRRDVETGVDQKILERDKRLLWELVGGWLDRELDKEK